MTSKKHKPKDGLKLNMRLTIKDADKIEECIEKYGFRTRTEVVRFLLHQYRIPGHQETWGPKR